MEWLAPMPAVDRRTRLRSVPPFGVGRSRFNGRYEHMTGRRILEIGGIIAGTLMIAFGIGALVMSINARNTVKDEVTAEQIVGSADMNPADIKVAMTEAGLKNVSAPTCNVADQPVENGTDARCFAQ